MSKQFDFFRVKKKNQNLDDEEFKIITLEEHKPKSKPKHKSKLLLAKFENLESNFLKLQKMVESLLEYSKTLLEYSKIGITHVLNENNVILFFKQMPIERARIAKAKLSDLKRYFHQSSKNEINLLIQEMYKKTLLKKDKNGFYYLKKNVDCE